VEEDETLPLLLQRRVSSREQLCCGSLSVIDGDWHEGVDFGLRSDNDQEYGLDNVRIPSSELTVE
jgi:hypothetical protein